MAKVTTKVFLIILNSCIWTLVIISSFTMKQQKEFIKIDSTEKINEKIQESFIYECKIDSILNVL